MDNNNRLACYVRTTTHKQKDNTYRSTPKYTTSHIKIGINLREIIIEVLCFHWKKFIELTIREPNVGNALELKTHSFSVYEKINWPFLFWIITKIRHQCLPFWKLICKIRRHFFHTYKLIFSNSWKSMRHVDNVVLVMKLKEHQFLLMYTDQRTTFFWEFWVCWDGCSVHQVAKKVTFWYMLNRINTFWCYIGFDRSETIAWVLWLKQINVLLLIL